MAGSYFSHDSNARNDSKILNLRLDLGAKGYGIYFMILERMRDEEDYTSTTNYRMLAFDFHEEEQVIKQVVEDYELFEFSEDGTKFYSTSLHERMKKMEEKSKKYREAGKKGAKKRWQEKKPSNSNAIKKDSNAIATLKPSYSQAIATLKKGNSKAISQLMRFDSNKIKLNKIKRNKIKVNKIKRNNNAKSKESNHPIKALALTNTQQLRNDFELLWKIYPKKQRKEDAFKGYKKARKDGVTNKEIQDGIVNWKKHISIKQLDLEFVPQGGTWFNQRRWQDELDMSPPHHNFGKGRVEQLPDWATKENTIKETKLDPEKEQALREKIMKLKSSQEVAQ